MSILEVVLLLLVNSCY